MAIMLAKTYRAFKAAGVPEEDAIAAAEELAAYENRLGSIENRLGSVENRLDSIETRLIAGGTKIAELAGKITVLTWGVGINAAATIAILGILLRGHGPLA
jgi:phage shock protein A